MINCGAQTTLVACQLQAPLIVFQSQWPFSWKCEVPTRTWKVCYLGFSGLDKWDLFLLLWLSKRLTHCPLHFNCNHLETKGLFVGRSWENVALSKWNVSQLKEAAIVTCVSFFPCVVGVCGGFWWDWIMQDWISWRCVQRCLTEGCTWRTAASQWYCPIQASPCSTQTTNQCLGQLSSISGINFSVTQESRGTILDSRRAHKSLRYIIGWLLVSWKIQGFFLCKFPVCI